MYQDPLPNVPVGGGCDLEGRLEMGNRFLRPAFG